MLCKANYELEKERQISFLDVLITRTENNTFETTVFRKETNTNLYINWNSHAPVQWKIGTLRTLLKRSIIICSNEYLLKNEVNHLRNVFTKINDYPIRLVDQIINEELQKRNPNTTIVSNVVAETKKDDEKEEKIQLLLPFNGKQGTQLLSKMRKSLNKSLPINVKTSFIYESTKLSTQFPVKDKTKFEHRHNATYFSKCPETNCDESYVGETDRRINERIIDHNNRDKKNHTY